MWIKSKLSLSGCLVLLALFFLALPISAQNVILTAEELQEWEAILKKEEQLNARDRELNREDRVALTEDQNQLKADRDQLEKDKKLFQREKELNKKERNLLNENEAYWTALKKDLNSEYWRGFFTGLAIGFPSGGSLGMFGGFKLGISIRF